MINLLANPSGLHEHMNPGGRPVPGGVYHLCLDTNNGPLVIGLDTAGLLRLHAMLDPWARALEAREASRGKQGQG